MGGREGGREGGGGGRRGRDGGTEVNSKLRVECTE